MTEIKTKKNILHCFHDTHEEPITINGNNHIYRSNQSIIEKESIIKYFESTKEYYNVNMQLKEGQVLLKVVIDDKISESVAITAFDPKWKESKIVNLIPDSINQNTYIILKIIREPFFIKSMNVLTEDSNGDVINVSMYEVIKEYNITDIKQANILFANGKYLLILNPYSKNHFDGSFGIRVENPKGIIKIFTDKEEVELFVKGGKEPSTSTILEECKLKGNHNMTKKNYKEATVNYQEALKYDPSSVVLNSNISQAYLKCKFYSKAKEYADIALKEDMNHTKSHYRKCRALIGMKCYAEAYALATSDHLKDIAEKDSLLKEIQTKLDNTKGIYNMTEMFEKEKSDFYLDYGDYISPKITKGHDKEKGIKIIVNSNISKGELISATKAIAAYSLIDPKNTDDEDETQLEQFQSDLAEQVLTNLDDYHEVFKCDNRDNIEQSYEERGAPKEDKDKIKKIITRIIEVNTKSSSRLIIKNKKYSIAKGLWIFPSLFNHSCIPNCFAYGVGDFVFIIAENDIKKNDELTINYCPNPDSNLSRRETLLLSWYFDCKCNYCKGLTNKKRADLINRLDKFITSLVDQQNKRQEDGFCTNMLKLLNENTAMLTSYEISIAYFLLGNSLHSKYSQSKMNYYEKALHYAKDRVPSIERLILYQIICLKQKLSIESNDTKQLLMKNIMKFIHSDIQFCEYYLSSNSKDYNMVFD